MAEPIELMGEPVVTVANDHKGRPGDHTARSRIDEGRQTICVTTSGNYRPAGDWEIRTVYFASDGETHIRLTNPETRYSTDPPAAYGVEL